MELYILDNDLRRVEVVDKFRSLIWTERFQEYGDFELVIDSNQKNKLLFEYGDRVIVNKSNRIMTIEEIENKIDSDGNKYITVKGSSLEKALTDKVASYGLSNLNSIDKGTVTINATGVASTSTITLANHGLINGDAVYFTTTGNLPGYKVSSISGWSTTSDCFRYNNHGLSTGTMVFIKKTGTNPTAITNSTAYYLIENSPALLGLATSNQNAIDLNYIDITNSGSATLYLGMQNYETFYVKVVDSNNFQICLNYEDIANNQPLELYGTFNGFINLWFLHGGKWRIKGTPSEILNEIFNRFCVNGYLSSTDVLPNYEAGSIYESSNIPLETSIYTLDINVMSVYDALKQLSKLYGLGFRITRKYETKKINFNIYSGIDRTLSQKIKKPVVFDLNMDNLMDQTEYISIKNKKNVAYVYSNNGYVTVTVDDGSTATGFDKKVIYVDASDIDVPAGSKLTTLLEQRGYEALAENRTLNAFDGQIAEYNSYVYDLDYMLGDLVEVRNSDGYSTTKRVTEQIFSDDSEGEKSYPTLSSELVIIQGSWLRWAQDQQWQQVIATVKWNEL